MMRASHDHPGNGPVSDDFSRCIVFLKQLGEIYWHASFYNEFFELAGSQSQTTRDMPSGERDPLVTFLNDRMPGRQQFCKVLEPQNQCGIRRRIVVDTVDDEQLGQDTRPKGQSHVLASNESGLTVLPSETTQTAMAHMTDPGSLDTEEVTLLDPGAQLFEDWLVDLGSFHNIFPSA
jgi:hypothetical protein